MQVDLYGACRAILSVPLLCYTYS